uniref:Uncharacterized protein n=1 Tax=Bicosoecida sp. CB-2014 TaxID=1486930 RepID=A0A7S1CGK9_9STRA|mmetsp:Transcript_26171/g.91049  ORF Transcript_26171/g.91049 Transcript_26171/m.91049 type:complete len:222 (+) Transcript_26171:110-775(+)
MARLAPMASAMLAALLISTTAARAAAQAVYQWPAEYSMKFNMSYIAGNTGSQWSLGSEYAKAGAFASSFSTRIGDGPPFNFVQHQFCRAGNYSYEENIPLDSSRRGSCSATCSGGKACGTGSACGDDACASLGVRGLGAAYLPNAHNFGAECGNQYGGTGTEFSFSGFAGDYFGLCVDSEGVPLRLTLSTTNEEHHLVDISAFEATAPPDATFDPLMPCHC